MPRVASDKGGQGTAPLLRPRPPSCTFSLSFIPYCVLRIAYCVDRAAHFDPHCRFCVFGIMARPDFDPHCDLRIAYCVLQVLIPRDIIYRSCGQRVLQGGDLTRDSSYMQGTTGPGSRGTCVCRRHLFRLMEGCFTANGRWNAHAPQGSDRLTSTY